MLVSMKHRDGFTLIELLVTITIMAILLGLAVVSLQGNQLAARDEERKTDVDVIARMLENYYDSIVSKEISPVLAPASSLVSVDRVALASLPGHGQYPPTMLMNSESTIKSTLPDIEQKALRAPGVAESSSVSLIVATTTSTSQNPTINQYIYQPLQANGTLCTASGDECRKFNLYYKLESSSTTQVITSRHQ